jgi:hypothetical protein
MTGPTPSKPLMTRCQALKFINSLGFPISKDHFDKLCLPSRRGGPPVAARWGLRPMYDEDGLRNWAMSRSSKNPADRAA